MIPVDTLLDAYAHGLFPMADQRTCPEIYWVEPRLRGQLPIMGLHIPARLLRTIRRAPYAIRINTDFTGVIDGCAQTRPESWINETIRASYISLHVAGYAHSVEAWQGDTLVGGLYGVTIGSVFCGESMFTHAKDASKVALVHLCARLWRAGFTILDTQFINSHLQQFGAYEMPQVEYVHALQRTLGDRPDFLMVDEDENMLVTSYLRARGVL